MLEWLGRSFGLPKEMLPYTDDGLSNQIGGGTILSSASECIFISLASAIYGAKGPRENMVIYASTQAHVSVEKACRLLGVCLYKVPVDTHTFSMLPECLEQSMSADISAGRVPTAVVFTMGTTSCGAIDDISKISAITRPLGVYFHVDGAYGGSALLFRKMRASAHLQHIDAININPNKCLQVTLCCRCLWLKDRRNLVRLQPNAFYLDYSETGDYQFSGQRAAGLSLSRRFRALKLFFVLMLIGVGKLRATLNSRMVATNQIFTSLQKTYPQPDIRT